MLDFFIGSALAQTAAPASGAAPDFLTKLLAGPWFLVIMLVLFYFLLIRPQMKRNKEARQMIEKIAKGDEVIISGGLAGKISNIGETFFTIEVADGVNVKVQKSAVGSVLPKGTLKSL